MTDRAAIQDALGEGHGLLRLEPSWVPRSFMHPGRRLRLHPDDLYAFGGSDTLVGGIGADRLFAGAGNDTILARDRARDTIVCGAGRDVVQADPTDRVARDCERVTRVRR